MVFEGTDGIRWYLRVQMVLLDGIECCTCACFAHAWVLAFMYVSMKWSYTHTHTHTHTHTPDNENRGVDVGHGALGQRLDRHWKIAVVFLFQHVTHDKLDEYMCIVNTSSLTTECVLLL